MVSEEKEEVRLRDEGEGEVEEEDGAEVQRGVQRLSCNRGGRLRRETRLHRRTIRRKNQVPVLRNDQRSLLAVLGKRDNREGELVEVGKRLRT